MRFRRIETKILMQLLAKRLVLFLLFINVLGLLLYGVGNYQYFMAKTQKMILSMLIWSGSLLGTSSFFTLWYNIVLVRIKQKKWSLAVFLGYGGALFLGATLSLLAAFLLQMTAGK
ncbi:MAG: hypothetical protein SNJ56_06830 [Termitinemataceae bacterium]